MNSMSAKEIVQLAIKLPGYRIVLYGNSRQLMKDIRSYAIQEHKNQVVKATSEELVLGSCEKDFSKCSRIRHFPPNANKVRGYVCDFVLDVDKST